jgi:hypothetical protein
VSRNCKELEQKYNIPSLGGAASNIIDYALNHNFKIYQWITNKIYILSFPGGRSAQAVHHKYIFESNDVVSGKPMMQAFVDALTAPLTEKEKYKGPPPQDEVAKEPGGTTPFRA